MKLTARSFRITASVALLLARCGMAQTPTKARNMGGFRFDSIQVEKVQAPPNTSPQLHWVIPGIPNDTQVVFAEDDRVRNRVIQELTKWRTDPTRDHKWLLDDGTQWSLIQQLKAALNNEYDMILVLPKDLRLPPTDEASVPSTRALTISVKETPVPDITSMAMTLETVSAKGAADQIQHTDTVGSIATLLKRPAPEAAEAGIPVTLSYSKEEAQALGEDFVREALGEVALNAAAVLRRFDYRKGSKKPPTTQQVVEATISGPYAIGDGDFPGLTVAGSECKVRTPWRHE